MKHTNEKLVRKTVVRMPPKYVAQFLQLIVNKFQVYLLSDTQLSYNPNFIHWVNFSIICNLMSLAFDELIIITRPVSNEDLTVCQAKPSRGLMLMVWIRSVLVTHASFLLTLPDLVNVVQGLYRCDNVSCAKCLLPCCTKLHSHSTEPHVYNQIIEMGIIRAIYYEFIKQREFYCCGPINWLMFTFSVSLIHG